MQSTTAGGNREEGARPEAVAVPPMRVWNVPARQVPVPGRYCHPPPERTVHRAKGHRSTTSKLTTGLALELAAKRRHLPARSATRRTTHRTEPVAVEATRPPPTAALAAPEEALTATDSL